MAFVFIWTLLVPNISISAETRVVSFGFRGAEVREEEGKRVAEVYLDDSAKEDLKVVKLYTKVMKYSYASGPEYVQEPTWNLQLNEESKIIGYLEEKDITSFGEYVIDKVEIIKEDNSKNILFNSMFYSELGENDKENAVLENFEFSIGWESSPLSLDEGNFEKKLVILGEEQTLTFKINSSSEIVQAKQVYVTFNRSDSNEESNPIVILASKNEEDIYQAKESITGSLNTGDWTVEKIDITDNFERNISITPYLGSFKVVSENTDITPPKLVSIELTGDTYDFKSEEEKPKFIIEATDDLAGVRDSINIELVDKEDKNNTISIWSYKEWNGERFIADIYEGYIKANGVYEIKYVSLTDNASNNIIYINPKYKESYHNDGYVERDFSNLELTIVNFEESTKANISVEELVNNKNEVANGNEIDFSATIKSDKLANYAYITFTNDNNKTIYISSNNYHSEEAEDGCYLFEFKPNNDQFKYLASGNYRVEYMGIQYYYGNNSSEEEYFYDERSEYIGEDYKTYNFKELDFTCKNENEDIIPPSITNISVDKGIITPGEAVEITIEVEDDNSGFIYNEYDSRNMYVYYKNISDGIALYYDRESSSFKGTIEIPNYSSTGVYNISSISLYDVADNSQYYSWWNNEDKVLLSQGTILVKSDLNEQLPPTITCNAKDGQYYKAPFTPLVTSDHGDIARLLNGKQYDSSPIEKAGNYTLFITATGLDGSVTTAKVYFTVTLEINNDTTVDDIIDYIQSSEDKNVVIEVNSDDKTIKEDIFEAIKGTNKIVSFAQKNEEGKEEVVWTFEGEDITGSYRDIKLSVTNNADEENKDAIYDIDEEAYVIHFDHHRELPGKASVKVYVGLDNKLTGKDLTFYYFNSETGKPEKVQGPLGIDKDGYVTVEITHCSDYFLSVDDSLDPNDKLPVISVEQSEVELKVGEKLKLNVKVDLTTVDVTYVSLNESIVTVSNEGEIEAVGAGETEVKIEAGKATAFVKIKVNNDEPIIPEESNPEDSQPETPNPEQPKSEYPQPEIPKQEESKSEVSQQENDKLPQTGGASTVATLTIGLLLLGGGVYTRRKNNKSIS